MAQREVLEEEFRQRLASVKTENARFAFDRDGRPGAIAAIRAALPMMERELLEAVIEDCECELAATREAFLQMLIESSN
jgi:hypothetical protein